MDSNDHLKRIDAAVENRWKHLTDIVTETITEGLKYLTVVHLAGMGGVLSFMGATKTLSISLTLAFASFFVGAASVGACYFFRYFHFDKLVEGWIADTREMYEGALSMSWSDVVMRDRKRTKLPVDPGLYASIMSYVCFIAGGILGFIGVYAYVAGVH